MDTTDLPCAHFPSPATAAHAAWLGATLDALAERQVYTPGALGWLSGAPVHGGPWPAAILACAPHDLSALALWADALSARGYTGIAALATDRLGEPGQPAADALGWLLGLGVVVASAGTTGEPLRGARVATLRDALPASRAALSAACGYPVRALIPPVDHLGRAADPLLEDEAARAGYTWIATPGLPGARQATATPYGWRQPARHLRFEDDPREVAAWLAGESLRAQLLGSARDAFGRLLRLADS